MISIKEKVVIFDPVKTGSTSIRSLFSQHYNVNTRKIKHSKVITNDYRYLNFDNDTKIIFENNKKIQQGNNFIFLDIDNFKINYKKIVLVRNPFDRILSLFRYRLKKKSKIVKGLKYNSIDFEKYLINNMSSIKYPERGKENHNLLPITEIIKYGDEYLVNELIRFENFSHDVLDVFNNHLHKKIEKVPHLKKTNNFSPYREMYNDKTKNIIQELYKEDLEYFSYIF